MTVVSTHNSRPNSSTGRSIGSAVRLALDCGDSLELFTPLGRATTLWSSGDSLKDEGAVSALVGVSSRDTRLASEVPPARRSWPQGWPLIALYVGYPVWWALGLGTFAVMAVACAMSVQLYRQKEPIRLPPGFGLWLLFLVWVALGVLVLFADAPGAVPGGGASRMLVFGYRFAWYLSATVFLVWITNQPRETVTDRFVFRLLGWMFVVTAIGGLAGVLLPTFEWQSPVELVLPSGLRSNALVQRIVHPELADVQNALGYAEARPKAPFAYANSWGSNLALCAVFFLPAWLGRDGGWRRFVGVVILVLAAVPVVYSLNRGLWACLALGVVGLLILQILRGRVFALIATFLVVVLALLALAFSPLGNIYGDRINNPHSNERRSQLLEETVRSTIQGSPVVGFGSTRDVQGSFASIAGGSTPDCPACGVPPLGTQGLLWMVIFTQGLVGMIWFLSFLVVSLHRCWRCRTPVETTCTFVLAFLAVQLPIYDVLDVPILVVMLAIGMVAREQAGEPQRVVGSGSQFDRLVAKTRKYVPITLVLGTLGAASGLVVALSQPVGFTSQASVLLTPYPTALRVENLSDPSDKLRETTVDTEAAILLSEDVLEPAVRASSYSSPEQLRRQLDVSAYTSTRVLRVELHGSSRSETERVVRQIAEGYLVQRQVYLEQRQQQVLAKLREQRNQLSPLDSAGTEASTVLTAQQAAEDMGSLQTLLDTAVVNAILTPTTPGEVLRILPSRRVSRSFEVPVATGLALGLMAGAAVMWLGVEPRRRHRIV